MLIDGTHYRTIWPSQDGESVCIIDQRHLPFAVEFETIRTWQEMVAAIRDMHLRGAPLIGAAAGYGVYLACLELAGQQADAFDAGLERAMAELDAARPTAVNLRWALDRQRASLSKAATTEEKTTAARQTADAIAEEDAAICAELGRRGADLLARIAENKQGQPVNVLTHCNAGWLATVDYGTVTAVIYEAASRGIPLHVWVDETRPRNQGALTSWELTQNGVANTVICDNAGGHLMQHGLVDLVLVGTDRTARNGDVANKIGTYLKALAARDNNVPFYVALPSPSYDASMPEGVGAIPIEERDPDEVLAVRGEADGAVRGVRLYAEGTAAANFAFDVTPARLITGYVTELGVFGADELADRLAGPSEGTIKFKVGEHRRTLPLDRDEYAMVEEYRDRLWKLGLVGFSEAAGYGYGNISARRAAGGFLISGTQTGHKPTLDGSDYVIVDRWDFAANTVHCTGPCLPSSEALSHAALYQRREIGAVIHVHSAPLWCALMHADVLFTEEHIPYGSEMLYTRLTELIVDATPRPSVPFLLVMRGHEDGVFSAGATMEEAFRVIEEQVSALREDS